MKQYIYLLTIIILFIHCSEKNSPKNVYSIHDLAMDYVRLGLDIGRYDESFVDAYYGPDSLKPLSPKQDRFPKDSFLQAVHKLQEKCSLLSKTCTVPSSKNRLNWMESQLRSIDSRIRIFSGEFQSFDEESKELFDGKAPHYPESHFQNLIQQLDHILPGKGSIPQRFQNLSNRFIIPQDKLDTVFKLAIAECRRRTMEHYTLPANENFKLEFVNNKPWSGYNWYKGNYQSVIQINTDLKIFIDRAIDVGSHESYPGHHVYNMLLEKNLFRDSSWIEISMYLLYSPQSLIAEGTANYGIDVVFPGDDKINFCKDFLLPLAHLDTTGISNYFQCLSIRSQLNFARNEAARSFLDHTMDSTSCVQWMMNYCLMNEETAVKSLQFIKVNRSYIINYNYGQELVKNYVEHQMKGSTDAHQRWEVFKTLLINPVRPSDLMKGLENN